MCTSSRIACSCPGVSDAAGDGFGFGGLEGLASGAGAGFIPPAGAGFASGGSEGLAPGGEGFASGGAAGFGSGAGEGGAVGAGGGNCEYATTPVSSTHQCSVCAAACAAIPPTTITLKTVSRAEPGLLR